MHLPLLPCADSQAGGTPQLWRSPSEQQEVQASAWGPTLGRGGPITLDFVNQWDLHWENQRAVENQGCAHPKSQGRGSHLENPRLHMKVIPWLILRCVVEGRDLLELSLGIEVWWMLSMPCYFFIFLPPSWPDTVRHHF